MIKIRIPRGEGDLSCKFFGVLRVADEVREEEAREQRAVRIK